MTGISGLRPFSWASAAPRAANPTEQQPAQDTFTTSGDDFRPTNLREMLSLTQPGGQARALSEPSPKHNPAFQSGSDCGAQSCHRRPGEKAGSLSKEDTLNYLQMMLDVGGCVPVLSTPFALANALVSAARGNTKEALLNLACAIPVAGVVGKAGLLIKGAAALKGGVLAGAAAKSGIAQAGMGVFLARNTTHYVLPNMAASEDVYRAARAMLEAKDEEASLARRVVGAKPAQPGGHSTRHGSQQPPSGGSAPESPRQPAGQTSPDGSSREPNLTALDKFFKPAAAAFPRAVVESLGVDGLIQAMKAGDGRLLELVHTSSHCEGVSPSDWHRVKQIAEKIIHDNPHLYGALI